MSRKKAIAAMILGSLCWSFAGLWIKQLSWHPLVIAGGRSLVAGSFMLFFLKKREVKFSKNVFAGAFFYLLVAGLFVVANKLTTSTNAILLQFTAPIWVVIFGAIFWGEKPQKKDIYVVAIVLLGMVLFFLGDLQLGGIVGNLCAIMAGMSVAMMIKFMQRDKQINPLLMTIVGNFLLFFATLPFFFIYPPLLNIINIKTILLLGVFQLGMGYILFTYAVHYVSSLDAALLMVIEPLFNPIWVLLFLGERPSIYALLGGGIVLTTIVLYQVSLAKNSKNMSL